MSVNEKIKILLIDDKESNLFSLEELLSDNVREFYKANSGEAGLRIAFNQIIDLIILDVHMPEMDGFEVARILKSYNRTKEIPIIFASAEKKDQYDVLKGFEEGAVDYLPKPLDPEVTKAKVSVLLQLQTQKRELIQKNISLEKAALLIDNSTDVIGIVNGRTLKFDQVNPALSRILGYEKEEIINLGFSDFINTALQQLFDDHDPDKEGKITFESPSKTKNKETVWIQWNVVIKDEQWFVVGRDVTAIKKAEEAKVLLSTVVKHSTDAIYIIDFHKNIISWNEGAVRIYGISESEALHSKIEKIIPVNYKSQFLTNFEKVKGGEQLRSLETQRITKSGKVIDVLLAASLIADKDGLHNSIAITEKEITTQKNHERKIQELNSKLRKNNFQLQHLNEDLESFSYSVSHDLKAPLRAIRSYSEILKKENEDKMDADSKDILSYIIKNGARMNDLIEDLLKFSGLGRKEIQKFNVDMSEVVKSIINELNISQDEKKNIKVGPLPNALADYQLIKIVWTNLILNAIKYSSKQEERNINIYAIPSDKEPVYCIEDNGVGFKMEYASKLFGVFQRLHSSEEFEGTGIGLAIVNKIVKKHNGNVWAESEPDKGAKFYFSLPPQKDA